MVFRIEKTKDYTVMSNHHLRNVALSLKAKGLLSLMLSLPDTWDYSLNGLASICGDGVSSISTGIKELEKEGYVTREQSRSASGQMGTVDYLVREVPLSENTTTTPLPPQGEKPLTANPLSEEPLSEKHVQSSTKELSTNKLSTNKLIPNQSFIPEEPHEKTDWTERMEVKELEIKQQIEYDILIDRFEQEQVDELVDVMLGVYLTREESIRIGRKLELTCLVHRMYNKIDFACIEQIILNLKTNNTKIKDMKAYLIKCLYNAPQTKHNQVKSEVQHDMEQCRASKEKSYFDDERLYEI